MELKSEKCGGVLYLTLVRYILEPPFAAITSSNLLVYVFNFKIKYIYFFTLSSSFYATDLQLQWDSALNFDNATQTHEYALISAIAL